MDVRPMIEISNVTKRYNQAFLAVDHINLSVNSGVIMGFIGPNGAGKTTTIKMMTGILKSDTGTILMNGKNIQTEAIEAKRQFGFIPDDPNAFLKLKAMEYLNFIADIYGVEAKTRQERIQYYSERLHISDALNDRIASFSHGMRQKIMIIAQLIHDPEILILDEPLTGLDPQSAFELKEIMRERTRENKTVFFSTHVLEVAEKLCDQIAIIRKGSIVYEGTLEVLKEEYPDKSLEDIFFEVIG